MRCTIGKCNAHNSLSYAAHFGMLRLLGCMLLLLSVVLQLELQLEGLGLGIPIEYVATCKHGTSKGVHPDRHSVAMRKAYRHVCTRLVCTI
jgi:hypothetical protein